MIRRVEARSAVETRRMIAEKKMSALEAVNESLGTIEKLDKDVRAFLDVDFDGEALEQRVENGPSFLVGQLDNVFARRPVVLSAYGVEEDIGPKPADETTGRVSCVKKG